jgi:outer membrane receptor protein involved in Fe transport
MTLKNRYLDFKSEVKPSQDLIKLFGGFKGKFSRNISYLFEIDYSIKSNEPFYYLKQTNYPTVSDEVYNLFSVKYDDLNVLRLGGNVRYSSGNVTVALQGNYYSYKAGNNTTITHLPDYDFSFVTTVPITSKIKGRFNATVIGPRKAEIEVSTYNINPSTGLLSGPVTILKNYDLKTIIDVSLGADYSYTNNLNFFIDVRNLLNQNYEVWHGYNAQGILIMAGARYTF